MPSALLVADLPLAAARAVQRGAEPIRTVDRADVPELAALYLAGYPSSVGAATLDEAVTEMSRTFDGAYGEIRRDLSLLATAEGAPAGAVLTTAASVWDDVDAPFIIDFFVLPAQRGRGIGRRLLEDLADRASASGASRLALRVNAGTSPQAQHLYSGLGFRRRQR